MVNTLTLFSATTTEVVKYRVVKVFFVSFFVKVIMIKTLLVERLRDFILRVVLL